MPDFATRAGMRKDMPIECIEVGEDPTTCTHCGAHTELISVHTDGMRRERCLHCQQEYEVTDEIEIVDEDTGVVIGTTVRPPSGPPGMRRADLDAVLAELTGELPEASQADLNHLFGIKPSEYGDDFGSF